MVGELAGISGAFVGALAIFGLFAGLYAIAELTKTRLEIARLDERMMHAKTIMQDAFTVAHAASRNANVAINEAARAIVKADAAHVEVEAQKKATHTIQMVPVDDVADKALNGTMDGLEGDDMTFNDLQRATAGMENLL